MPKTGQPIDNWPEQNYANGCVLNENTGRRYKGVVRALKRLENELVEVGRLPSPVHGYFIESVLYNLPASTYRRERFKDTTLDVLSVIVNDIERGAHGDWVEVNGLKWLWRSGQTWTASEALLFARTALTYIEEK